MKAAAVNPSRKSVGLIELEEPRLSAPDDVLFRVLQVGVCGTDREICSFEYGTPPADSAGFLVLGHEALGEVIEAGPEAHGWKPGDLLVPMVRRPCSHPECVACRSGRQDFCYTGDFTERGIKQRHGFMTERVVDQARYLNPVPAGLRDVAVLVEPLTIAEKSLLQIELVQKRLPWSCRETPDAPRQACHRAVVLGAGPVGLLGAMTLVLAGFETWVYSRTPAPNESSKICDRIGARYLSSQETPVDEMAKRVGNIDVVYEAVGASPFAFDVLRVLGTNGLFVFTGVPSTGTAVAIDTGLLMRNLVLKNQCVLGSVNAGQDAFQNAIRDLSECFRRWPDAVRSLITARFPLERFEEPIHAHDGIKNIIEVGG